MKNLTVKCGSIDISNSNKICLIAGPCQLEQNNMPWTCLEKSKK